MVKDLWTHVKKAYIDCDDEKKDDRLFYYLKKNAIDQAKEGLCDNIRKKLRECGNVTEEDAKLMKDEFDGMVKVFPMWGEEGLSEIYTHLDSDSRQELRAYLHTKKLGPDAPCLFRRAAFTGESLEGSQSTFDIQVDIRGREALNDKFRCWGCAQVVMGEMIEWDEGSFEKFRFDQYHEPSMSEEWIKSSAVANKGLASETAKDDYKKNWHLTVEQHWEASLNLFKLNEGLWLQANEIRRKINIDRDERETLLVSLQKNNLRILEESLLDPVKEEKKNGEAINVKNMSKSLEERLDSMVQDDLSHAKDIYENLEESKKIEFRKKSGIKKGDSIIWKMLDEENYDFLLDQERDMLKFLLEEPDEEVVVTKEQLEFANHMIEEGKKGKLKFFRYCLENGLKLVSFNSVTRKSSGSDTSSDWLDISSDLSDWLDTSSDQDTHDDSYEDAILNDILKELDGDAIFTDFLQELDGLGTNPIAGSVTVKDEKETKAPIWKFFISKDKGTAVCRACDKYKEVSRANCNYNGQKKLGNIKMKMHLKSEHKELYKELIITEGEYFKNEKDLWNHVGEAKKACINDDIKDNRILNYFKKEAIEQAKKVLNDKVRDLRAEGKVITEEDAETLKKEFDSMTEVFPMWGEEGLSEMYKNLGKEDYSRQEFRMYLHRRKVGLKANCLFQRAAVTGESLDDLEPTVFIGRREDYTEASRCAGCAQAILGELIDWEAEGFNKFSLDRSHQPIAVKGKKIEYNHSEDSQSLQIRKDASYTPAEVKEAKGVFENNIKLWDYPWEASLKLFKLNRELWKEVNAIGKKLSIETNEQKTLFLHNKQLLFKGGDQYLINILNEKKKKGKAINIQEIVKTFEKTLEKMARDQLAESIQIYNNLSESAKKSFRCKSSMEEGCPINWEMLKKDKYPLLLEEHNKESEVEEKYIELYRQCVQNAERGMQDYMAPFITYCRQNGRCVDALVKKVGAIVFSKKASDQETSSKAMKKSSNEEKTNKDLNVKLQEAIVVKEKDLVSSNMASLSLKEDEEKSHDTEVPEMESVDCESHACAGPSWKRDRIENKVRGGKGKKKPEYDSELGKLGIEKTQEILMERETKKGMKRNLIKKLGITKTVNFTMVNKSAKRGEYGSILDPILDVSLSNVKNDLKTMLDVDQIAIPNRNKCMTIVFDYPLEKEFVFDLPFPSKLGFTRGQLATAISDKYKQIYKEEEETSTLPVESISQRCKRVGFTGSGSGFMNRAQTNGKYGIWGHDLEDLALSDVVFCPKKKRYYLFIES